MGHRFPFRGLRAALADDSGAVSADWVVVTALVVGLGLAVAAAGRSAVDGAAGRLSDDLGPVAARAADAVSP